MAKQVINVGTTSNDRTGDSIRSAFTKVNSNFTELYNAIFNEPSVRDIVGSIFADDSTLLVDAVAGKIVGPVFSNVTGNVTGNVIGNVTGNLTGNVTGNVTGNLVGDIRGSVFADDSSVMVNAIDRKLVSTTAEFGNIEIAGSVIATTDSSSITIDQAVNLNSNVNVGGDLLPQTANGGNLGSASNPWHSLYVSNSTIYIGGNALGLDNEGELVWNGSRIAHAGGEYITLDSLTDVNANSPNAGDTIVWSGGAWVNVTLPTLTSQLTNDSGFLTNSVLNNGLDADLKGSVFGDDSTILVDGVAGRIVGPVYTSTLRTDAAAIALGEGAAETNQGTQAIAIGRLAGQTDQGLRGIAIGHQAAYVSQGQRGIAIGTAAGAANQGAFAIAMGQDCANANQGTEAIALGTSAGQTNQGTYAIAIGYSAASSGQGANAIAIGRSAVNSNQTAGSIVLNATGTAVTAAAAGFYISPVRNTTGTSLLAYNSSTKEITHSNIIASEGDISIEINLSDSTLRRWSFGEDGDFTIPGNLIYGGDTIHAKESTSTAGNPLTVRAGDSETQVGGNLILRGGDTIGSVGTPRNSGWAVLRAGSTVTGNGGYAELLGGNTTAGTGGQAYVTAGSTTTGNGGPVEITAGDTVTGDGGSVTIESGEAVTGTAGNINITAKGTVTGDGGNVNLNGGSATSGNGGAINLTAGDTIGSGDPGTIRLRTFNAAAPQDWTFNFNGTLTFPDATVQNTAFTTDPTLNVLKIDDGVHERFQTKTNATGTVQHNCALGHIFYHTSPDANWTANFTNLNLSSNYATAVTLVIVQGGTGYYPSAVQIGGVGQTLNWQGNTTPTPSTNRTDVVTFSIINNSGTYTVLGQLTGF